MPVVVFEAEKMVVLEAWLKVRVTMAHIHVLRLYLKGAGVGASCHCQSPFWWASAAALEHIAPSPCNLRRPRRHAPPYDNYRSRAVTLLRPQLLQSPRLLDTLAVHQTKSMFTTCGILAAYYPPTFLSCWRASVGDFAEREWPTFTTKDRSQIKRAISTSMEMHICQCI